MELTDAVKKQIDAMTYQSMLAKWRHAPIGSTLFQGESGEYFQKRMRDLREEVGNAEHVRASKEIGWD